jgi:peroxiredoxin
VELPRLETLWRKYREKGLSVVAVEANGDRERATKFIKEKNLTFHLLDSDEEKNVVGGTFGIEWFPTLFTIDGEGDIVYCHVGFEEGDEAKLEADILRLIKD